MYKTKQDKNTGKCQKPNPLKMTPERHGHPPSQRILAVFTAAIISSDSPALRRAASPKKPLPRAWNRDGPIAGWSKWKIPKRNWMMIWVIMSTPD